MARKHHAWKLTGLDEIVYGEDLYGVHSISYAPMQEHETFRAFAMLRGNSFASQDELTETHRVTGDTHRPGDLPGRVPNGAGNSTSSSSRPTWSRRPWGRTGREWS